MKGDLEGVHGGPVVEEEAAGVVRVGVEAPVKDVGNVPTHEVMLQQRVPLPVLVHGPAANLAHDDRVRKASQEKTEPVIEEHVRVFEGHLSADGVAVNVRRKDERGAWKDRVERAAHGRKAAAPHGEGLLDTADKDEAVEMRAFSCDRVDKGQQKGAPHVPRNVSVRLVLDVHTEQVFVGAELPNDLLPRVHNEIARNVAGPGVLGNFVGDGVKVEQNDHVTIRRFLEENMHGVANRHVAEQGLVRRGETRG